MARDNTGGAQPAVRGIAIDPGPATVRPRHMASVRTATAAVAGLAAVVVAVAAWSASSGPSGPERRAARSFDTATPAAGLDWQYSATGLDRVPESALRSAGAIRIAVIDTGADVSAPGLASKRPAAYNVHTHTANVADTNGHGTLVASLAAGSVGDGAGVSGSGGDAQLLVVKAADAGGAFSTGDETVAIRYAVDHGARVINLSLGGTTTSAPERTAIRYAVEHGVLLVAAAGNDYGNGNPVEYPAALLQPPGSNGADGAGLVVAASTRDGSRAPFSNTGSWISLAAPGVGVFGALSERSSPVAYPRAAVAGSRGLFGYASGTSFAAPQVAGAAALVWGANPSLTARDVARILKETASGHGTWTPELGFGVIDVAAAVERASLTR
jgi:subtilisin family serine protease